MSSCEVSVIGVHDEGSRRDGRCVWCGRKFKAAAERPGPRHGERAALDVAYRYVYDPDWGSARTDD